jgi:hypothetical protein
MDKKPVAQYSSCNESDEQPSVLSDKKRENANDN